MMWRWLWRLLRMQIKNLNHVCEILMPMLSSCPHCNTQCWQLSPTVFALEEAKPKWPSKTMFPLLCVTCCECGNVQLFSAVALGVIPEEPLYAETSAKETP